MYQFVRRVTPGLLFCRRYVAAIHARCHLPRPLHHFGDSFLESERKTAPLFVDTTLLLL
jgi:hypothetical protein